MAAERIPLSHEHMGVPRGVPVLGGVLRLQRRTLLLWSLALTGVTVMYVGLYPSFAGADLTSFTEALPPELNEAFGYDKIGTPAGYLSSTLYGLLGPALLLVFAIGAGARLIAGQEEDGTLELELTAPVSRLRVLGERLVALIVDIVILVNVTAGVTAFLVVVLDIDIALGNVVAVSLGLLLLVLGFGTLALAVGAATGRRGVAVGAAAAVAVLAFAFDALGPSLDADWMTAVSPFSWYLAADPLAAGFDVEGLALLAVVPLVTSGAAFMWFRRRDLLV
jgi:ABC-2 type transport system permease protein